MRNIFMAFLVGLGFLVQGCHSICANYDRISNIEIYSVDFLSSIETVFDTRLVMGYHEHEYVKVADVSFARKFADIVCQRHPEPIGRNFYGHPRIVCILHQVSENRHSFNWKILYDV